jgi:plasmid stability protein
MISSRHWRPTTIMADILIRRISEETKELLRLRAERRGKSLEADLRETLDRLAREEVLSPDESSPFGSWLVAISRPGADLDEALAILRADRLVRLGWTEESQP